MIKAYHHVSRVPLERILRGGVISPVAFRLDPDEIWCLDALEEVYEDSFHEDANPEALRGMELLIEKRQEEVAAVSSRETDETGLFCGDFLAGDAFSVFLSTGQWGIIDEDASPHGFVFDAEELIDRGAVLRGDDLLGNYDSIIADAAWLKGPATLVRYKLEQQFDAIKKEWLLKGGAAIAHLRKDPDEWNEIVFEGSLNLDWAIEMWADGVLVPPVAKS